MSRWTTPWACRKLSPRSKSLQHPARSEPPRPLLRERAPNAVGEGRAGFGPHVLACGIALELLALGERLRHQLHHQVDLVRLIIPDHLRILRRWLAGDSALAAGREGGGPRRAGRCEGGRRRAAPPAPPPTRRPQRCRSAPLPEPRARGLSATEHGGSNAAERAAGSHRAGWSRWPSRPS